VVSVFKNVKEIYYCKTWNKFADNDWAQLRSFFSFIHESARPRWGTTFVENGSHDYKLFEWE